jgi:hypothetical protein
MALESELAISRLLEADTELIKAKIRIIRKIPTKK